jgi:hypothetical protein
MTQANGKTMDFSPLTDEQLLELIKSAMGEAVSRGVGQIASNIYLDAQEEARIKAEVVSMAQEKAKQAEIDRIKRESAHQVEKETREKQAKQQAINWAKKSALVTALKEHTLFEDDTDFSFNIWESQSGEVRIYLQGPPKGRRGHEWEIVYYATGSRYNPPKSIEGLSNNAQFKPVLTAFFDLTLKHWNPGLKTSYAAAANVEPHPEHLDKYRKALERPGKSATEEETANV